MIDKETPPQVSIKTEMLKQNFTACLCWRRIFRARVVDPPLDVTNVFYSFSPSGTMSVDDLHKFLIEHQGQKNATVADARAIFDSLKQHNIHNYKSGLHVKAFFRYLLSDHNLAHPPSSEVHHDMDAPMSHYFIFTGHNSYLTGNQFCSASSVVPIKRALLKGLRVVELDLWPDGDDDIKVCHGRTLTTKVRLPNCLQTIKENAFKASEYPVVITFEDHLNSKLRLKVVEMVNNILGDMLYTNKTCTIEQFLSPETLKKKILISCKPPNAYPNTKVENVPENESAILRHERQTSSEWNSADEEEDIPDEEEVQYRNLIAIHAGKLKGGGSENWLIDDPKVVSRISLSEKQLKKGVKIYGKKTVRFTQRNLLRVYPKGTRVDSSNYDPFIGWMHGAQMVAFNMQGYGNYLWMMQGMFKANGGCGYLKKPEFLLKKGPNDEVVDPNVPSDVKTVMKVKVILGEGWHQDFHHTPFDRCSPPDFYTRIGIAGAPKDKVTKKTQKVKDEWLPVWSEEFEFELTVPELALLRIKVLESDKGNSGFGGQACLPVSELRTGIRTVPLHDKKGNKYKHVRLLLNIDFEDCL